MEWYLDVFALGVLLLNWFADLVLTETHLADSFDVGFVGDLEGVLFSGYDIVNVAGLFDHVFVEFACLVYHLVVVDGYVEI